MGVNELLFLLLPLFSNLFAEGGDGRGRKFIWTDFFLERATCFY